jgi:uncharacterized membrane protein YjjP (DUF1212 family)
MDLETNKLVREMNNNKLDMEKYQKKMDILDEKIK